MFVIRRHVLPGRPDGIEIALELRDERPSLFVVFEQSRAQDLTLVR
jgi:hypothetical protein